MMDRQMDRLGDRWVDRRMHGQKGTGADGYSKMGMWADGWEDGWTKGWTGRADRRIRGEGYMDRWVGGLQSSALRLLYPLVWAGIPRAALGTAPSVVEQELGNGDGHLRRPAHRTAHFGNVFCRSQAGGIQEGGSREPAGTLSVLWKLGVRAAGIRGEASPAWPGLACQRLDHPWPITPQLFQEDAQLPPPTWVNLGHLLRLTDAAFLPRRE